MSFFLSLRCLTPTNKLKNQSVECQRGQTETCVLSHSVVSSFCDPIDCSSPGSSVHRYAPGENTGVGCHVLLQGIFPTQGSNPGLTCQGDSLPYEPPGKPKNTGVGSLSLLQVIFLTFASNRDLLHCRWILYQLSYQGSPASHEY